MSYDIDIAMGLNKRNNIQNIGAVLGNVLSINPLKVSILDNELMIDEDNGYICSNLIEDIIETVNINGVDTTVTFKKTLKVGDIVLVIADTTDQKYFVIDKVEVMK
ncbi:DUF2577 domain-containing protein [Clostridium estertheticum]|uniref:DUF2577 family protein n=1 Tax=Clostridium estertheticum TaxID=238834 RepID=UPI001C6EB949|nr:DUF2577 family protein [Clostridium estertheticum]MBW9170784.1 DUF2577 domain-containing protein [Clostridium estertheticum]WLC74377.1 DUF2577 domain-containing protein [Clostridium estertheticum]